VIVLDSSVLCAYHNTRDVHHPAARDVVARLVAGEWDRGLLLEYVFLEVVTVLLARRGADTAMAAATALLEARELDFVPCSPFFRDTLLTFQSQARRILSFTDATIVTVARQRKAALATFDRGFRDVPGLDLIP
jgi:predicted nucleic acid-binding protein